MVTGRMCGTKNPGVPATGVDARRKTGCFRRLTQREENGINKLVVEARAELDTSKRRVLYYECQVIVNEHGGALVPMFANFIMALDKSVMHDKLAGTFDYDGYKAAERWWFA